MLHIVNLNFNNRTNMNLNGIKPVFTGRLAGLKSDVFEKSVTFGRSTNSNIENNEIYSRFYNESPKIVKDAMDFAKERHDGQLRKHPDPDKRGPYYTHCYNTGIRLKKLGYNDDVVAAGMLHDTIEDTNTTYDELASRFNKNIADLVNDVSHEFDNPDWQEKQKAYREHIKIVSSEAKAISACDKIDNMNSSINLAKEGYKPFEKLAAAPEQQITKFTNLYNVFKESLPNPLVKEYRDTLNELRRYVDPECTELG